MAVPNTTASFAKRIYLPRILGSGVGFWAIAAVLYAVQPPTWVWAVLLFNGYVWPHVAYFLARRVPVPYLVERRNMLVECAFGGLWVAAMQFNALPSTLLVSMLCMNCIAVGGMGLLRAGMAVLLGVLGASAMILKPSFLPQTSHLQVYACLPMLAIYPMAVGGAAYRLAAKLAEHKRAFRDFSRLDSLTGLLNQGAWRTALTEEFAMARRSHAIVTLVLIDIDHFKHINDTHGHLIGDEVIRLFSGVLKNNRRATDVAGRIGGDEFGLVLGATNNAQASFALERLKRQLRDEFAARPDLPAVNLSIGIAEYAPHIASVEDWISVCDQALYDAKRNGRNTIRTAGLKASA